MSNQDRVDELVLELLDSGRTPEEICRDLELTETQFRLIKSRAKARFGEMGKRRLALRNITPFAQ